LDRYLSKVQIRKDQVQLLGLVCLFIASKFEEIHQPVIDELIYISDHSYSRKQILMMEQHILNVLNFNLAAATQRIFLKRFLKAAQSDSKTCFLAYYLAELMLPEYSMLQYPPSLIAACAVCLAKYTLKLADWSPTFEHFSTYKTTDQKFQSCIREMHGIYKNAHKCPQKSIREKYSHTPYMRVSLIPPL